MAFVVDPTAPSASTFSGVKRLAPSSHLSGSGAFVTQIAPTEREAVGIDAVPKLKHVAFEHKALDPEEKLALAQVRYHSGAWEKGTQSRPFSAASAFKLDSSGTAAALKQVPGEVLPPVPAHKGRTVRAEVDHIMSEGMLTASGPVEARPTAVSPARARTLELQSGAGVASIITGAAGHEQARRRSIGSLHTDSSYGQGVYGSTSTKGGTGADRYRHYSSHLTGYGVGALLTGTALPQAISVAPPTGDASDLGPSVKVLAAHPPRPGTANAHGRQPLWDGNASARRPGTASAAAAAAAAGAAAAEALRPATASSDHFLTTNRTSFTGVATGGPRAHTPPRRKLHPVTAGHNDPYRKTSIY